MAIRSSRSSARPSRRPQQDSARSKASEPSAVGAELRWLGYGAFSIWIFLSLVSWSADDAGWFQQGPLPEPSNWLGRFGAWTADALLFGFGVSAVWFVALSAALSWVNWRTARRIREQQKAGLMSARVVQEQDPVLFTARRWVGFALLLSGSCALEAQRANLGDSPLAFMPGGALGSVIGSFGDWAVGSIGLTLVALALVVLGLSI